MSVRTRYICIFLFVFGFIVVSQAEETGSELDVLKDSLGNQEIFENKIHTFDKMHMAIAKGLYVKAKSFEKEKKVSEAYQAAEEAQRHIDLVQQAYEMGLNVFSNSAVLHNFYGEFVYDFLGNPHEAATHWKQALQLDNSCARAHCNFGMYALHNGMYATGFESLETALRLEPDNPNFLYNMVQVYFAHSLYLMQSHHYTREKIYKDAMEMSKRAARFLPEDFQVLRDYALNFFLGEEYGVKVKWKDAVQAWQDARSRARTKAEIFNTWLNEARVHKQNGDSKKSIECLNKAQAIWPESPVVKQLIEDFKEQ